MSLTPSATARSSIPPTLPPLLLIDLLILQTLRKKNKAQHRSALFFRKVEEIYRLGRRVYEEIEGWVEVQERIRGNRGKGSGDEVKGVDGRDDVVARLERLGKLLEKLFPALVKASQSAQKMIHHHHFLPLTTLLLSLYARLWILSLSIYAHLGISTSSVASIANREAGGEFLEMDLRSMGGTVLGHVDGAGDRDRGRGHSAMKGKSGLGLGLGLEEIIALATPSEEMNHRFYLARAELRERQAELLVLREKGKGKGEGEGDDESGEEYRDVDGGGVGGDERRSRGTGVRAGGGDGRGGEGEDVGTKIERRPVAPSGTVRTPTIVGSDRVAGTVIKKGKLSRSTEDADMSADMTPPFSGLMRLGDGRKKQNKRKGSSLPTSITGIGNHLMDLDDDQDYRQSFSNPGSGACTPRTDEIVTGGTGGGGGGDRTATHESASQPRLIVERKTIPWSEGRVGLVEGGKMVVEQDVMTRAETPGVKKRKKQSADLDGDGVEDAGPSGDGGPGEGGTNRGAGARTVKTKETETNETMQEEKKKTVKEARVAGKGKKRKSGMDDLFSTIDEGEGSGAEALQVQGKKKKKRLAEVEDSKTVHFGEDGKKVKKRIEAVGSAFSGGAMELDDDLPLRSQADRTPTATRAEPSGGHGSHKNDLCRDDGVGLQAREKGKVKTMAGAGNVGDKKGKKKGKRKKDDMDDIFGF